MHEAGACDCTSNAPIGNCSGLQMQEEIPANQARPTGQIRAAGPIIAQGHSVIDTVDDRQRKRIPTVLSFFHTGRRFVIASSASPPGVSLYFSNMTVLVANSTFTNLHSSGIMVFFELGRIAQFCFLNRCVPVPACHCALPQAQSTSAHAAVCWSYAPARTFLPQSQSSAVRQTRVMSTTLRTWTPFQLGSSRR
jgi:hypothetical protein